MSKTTDSLREFRNQLQSRIQKVDEEIDGLQAMKEEKRKERVSLRKALKAVGGSGEEESGSRIAPTLKHVRKAMPIAFQGLDRLPEEQLSRRLIQILKAQDSLSEQGLTLRVQQGISRLPKDSSGFVLAPSASANSADKPAVN